MKRCLSFLSSYISKSRIDKMQEVNLFCDNEEEAAERLAEIGTNPGIYVISGNRKYSYPNGNSNVIYIGKADNLARRLREHYNGFKYAIEDWGKNEDWVSNKYNYIYKHKATVYYLHTNNEDPKNLENKAMGAFYDKYRAIPVGNGARSFPKQSKA